ncbi:interleukin-21 [Engystomops pustulosus]|uniref:interleukin-21 n=1 Tax=Engystomops pustulosus TaxID=76066 RepID=UPI003AFB0310
MGKVLLYCMCLLALTALLHAALPSRSRCQELQKVVIKIREISNRTHPHSFHVPDEVKEECLHTALTCFRSETPKLQAATEKDKDVLEKILRKVKLSKPHDHEDCTPCSKYTQQSPEDFLNKMELLLQRIISNKARSLG